MAVTVTVGILEAGGTYTGLVWPLYKILIFWKSGEKMRRHYDKVFKILLAFL